MNGRNGAQYPNNPDRGVQRVPISEFKECPCSECGSFFHLTVVLSKFMIHRLNARLKTPLDQVWYFCAGCYVQIDDSGNKLPLGHPDTAPAEALKEVKRVSS